MGPFKVLARPAPNAYRLEIPAAWRACDELNVERLRPYHRRPDGLGGSPGSPPPVPGAVGGPEYEVQELLKMLWGRPFVLVSWVGGAAPRDPGEPLDNPTNCEEAIAAFERATVSALPRRGAGDRGGGVSAA